jgi:ER-bound oxygenase mpaB/B'/Rubber oxygenase, catalytic domain
MQLVYRQGPVIGQHLLGDDIEDTTKAIFEDWWSATLKLGRSVLEKTYGPYGSLADASLPFGEALPSFPISELSRTRSLFHQYGSEIGGALLLAALPQAYATSWGARVLAATGHLQNDRPGDLTRRIRATAQFVTFVLGPTGFVAEGDQSNGAIENAWDPRADNKGQAFRSVMGLRLLHQVIRTILTEQPNEEAKKAVDAVLGPENFQEPDPDDPLAKKPQPLNQEDLLATELLFCVTVFEVLEKFGLSWSMEDQTAYLTTWNMIGRLLGIVDWDEDDRLKEWPELNPTSVDGARRMLELLRIRQWMPVPPFVAEKVVPGDPSDPLDEVWNSLRPGRRLTKALLDELASAMGRHTRSWPLATMRELAPDVVRDRLGLGAHGLGMSLLDNLPNRTTTIGRFTKIRLPNVAKAATIRFMANTVTRDAVVSFLRSSDPPPFVLPGLEDWSANLTGSG